MQYPFKIHAKLHANENEFDLRTLNMQCLCFLMRAPSHASSFFVPFGPGRVGPGGPGGPGGPFIS
jgi:hypothetical protein